METKICSSCPGEKDISEFDLRSDTKKYRAQCRSCRLAKGREWREDNKEKKSSYQKEYVENNKEKVALTLSKWYQKNRDAVLVQQAEYDASHKEQKAARNRAWYQENKSKLRSGRAKYQRERIGRDPVFKLRARLSTAIYLVLKDNKRGDSILKHLPYTMAELKIHLESQFEPWMTWENWGPYRLDIWHDQDSATWTWQIDHIIPHSKFEYQSMEDQKFRECWALENLRPYSAKQNVIDGDRNDNS